jgi:hypothetical protein
LATGRRAAERTELIPRFIELRPPLSGRELELEARESRAIGRPEREVRESEDFGIADLIERTARRPIFFAESMTFLPLVRLPRTEEDDLRVEVLELAMSGFPLGNGRGRWTHSPHRRC